MATFKQRIEDLSGAIPATADGEQFIKDGRHDVINRMLVVAPNHADLFTKQLTIADGGTAVDNTHILNVHRDSSSCRLVASGARHAATDTGSLFYATATDPVYYVLDASMYVKPAGGTTVQATIIADGAVSNWDTGSSAIANFPEENYYQVIMYAAIQVLYHRLVEYAMPTMDTISEITYFGPDASNVTSITDVSVSDIVGLSTPPVYNGGSVVGITITAVSPTPPTLSTSSINFAGTAPEYTTPTTSINNVAWATAYPNTVSAVTAALGKIGTAVDQAATAASKFISADDSVFGDEETFLTGNSQLTRVKDALDRASDLINNNQPDASTDAFGAQAAEDIELVSSALSIAQTEIGRASTHIQEWVSIGDMRVKEVQVALQEADGFSKEVQAHLSPIAMEMQEYQTKMQDALNTFNKENTVYQAELQKSIQNAQLSDAADSKKLSKYQAELQQYQQEVGAQVAEHSQKMQDQLNLFNDANVEYQATLQKGVQDSQAKNNIALTNMQKDLQIATGDKDRDQMRKLNNSVEDTKAIMSNNGSKVAKFQADLTKATTQYQWIQGQVSMLKQQYDQSYMTNKPQ